MRKFIFVTGESQKMLECTRNHHNAHNRKAWCHCEITKKMLEGHDTSQRGNRPRRRDSGWRVEPSTQFFHHPSVLIGWESCIVNGDLLWHDTRTTRSRT